MSVNLKTQEHECFVFVFKRKTQEKGFTEQDKKHVRFMAVYQLIKDDSFSYVMKHNFTEKFRYDENKNEVTYVIKFIKEKGVDPYAKSQSNDKPN